MCDHGRLSILADVKRTGRSKGRMHFLATFAVRCSSCGMRMEFPLPTGGTKTELALPCRETVEVKDSQPKVVVQRGGMPDLDDADDGVDMPAPKKIAFEKP